MQYFLVLTYCVFNKALNSLQIRQWDPPALFLFANKKPRLYQMGQNNLTV